MTAEFVEEHEREAVFEITASREKPFRSARELWLWQMFLTPLSPNALQGAYVIERSVQGNQRIRRKSF